MAHQKEEKFLCKGALTLFALTFSVSAEAGTLATQVDSFISEPRKVKLSAIPQNAEIIFHSAKEGSQSQFIFVMDSNGENVTQITFEESRSYNHKAVSYDRRYVVATSFDDKRQSSLWRYDLEHGTESQLAPNFKSAGGGGVAISPEGYVYFVGVEKSNDSDNEQRGAALLDHKRSYPYRIRLNGTELEKLNDDNGAADISVSYDGSLITYVRSVIRPPRPYTEIWVANSDGSDSRLVHEAGAIQVASAHDPEITDDNQYVIFSMINSAVSPNFPDKANTAHDLWRFKLDGSGGTRLTEPGPISIVPNVKGDRIIFLEMSEAKKFTGASLINVDGSGYRQLKKRVGAPNWIPR